MTKVHHSSSSSSSSTSSSALSSFLGQPNSEREVFTIWMKSLIFNGSGCTVYNSKGRIAYRVDNYNYKEGDVVYLMNHRGEILFEIIKKKLRVFGRWEGYCCTGSKRDEMLPWFRVKRPFRSAFKDGSSSCEVWNSSRRHLMMRYKIEEMTQEASYKITEISGEIVAEVKRKQTESGVVLGDDVLTLMWSPTWITPLS